jgi:hypothetical protein
MIFFVKTILNMIYIPQSLRQKQRILFWYHEYLRHLGQTRAVNTIRNTMTWPGLTQDVEHGLFMFHLSSISNDKEGAKRKKYGLLPPKIAESDTIYLGHVLFGSSGSIYNKDTSQNTLSACTHNDRSSNTTQAGLKLTNPQISQQHPSRICFMIPGWNGTRNLSLLPLIMGL